MFTERGLGGTLIAVDGGIQTQTAASAVRAGTTVPVVGSGIFDREASVRQNL